MKKLIMTVLSTVLSVLNVFAVNANDTTIVYNGMDVHLSGNGPLSVKVDVSRSNSKVYSAVYEQSSDSFSISTSHRIIEDIPLLNLLSNDGKKRNKHNGCYAPQISCFSVGFNVPMNTVNDIPDNNVARSTTITFIPFDHAFPLSKNVGIGVGLGFEWENYRLTDDDFFKYDNASLTVVNAKQLYGPSAHMDESKLRTFGFVMPVMLGVRCGFFHFAAGAALNVVPRSRYYSKISTDDRVYKFNSSGLHHNTFGYDLTAQVGCGDFGLFARYAMTDLFKDDHGPKMNTLTCGFVFLF